VPAREITSGVDAASLHSPYTVRGAMLLMADTSPAIHAYKSLQISQLEVGSGGMIRNYNLLNYREIFFDGKPRPRSPLNRRPQRS
jgi:hypothetical protein